MVLFLRQMPPLYIHQWGRLISEPMPAAPGDPMRSQIQIGCINLNRRLNCQFRINATRQLEPELLACHHELMVAWCGLWGRELCWLKFLTLDHVGSLPEVGMCRDTYSSSTNIWQLFSTMGGLLFFQPSFSMLGKSIKWKFCHSLYLLTTIKSYLLNR